MVSELGFGCPKVVPQRRLLDEIALAEQIHAGNQLGRTASIGRVPGAILPTAVVGLRRQQRDAESDGDREWYLHLHVGLCR